MSVSLCLRTGTGRRAEGWQAFQRAVEAYRASGEAHAFAAGVARGLEAGSVYPGEVMERRAEVLAALEGLEGTSSVDACRLLETLAWPDTSPTGDEFAERARVMAKQLGLAGASWPWRLELRAASQVGNLGDLQRAMAIEERVFGERLALGSAVPPGAATPPSGLRPLMFGEIDQAELAYERARDFARTRRLLFREHVVTEALAGIALQRNDRHAFEAIEESLERNVSTLPAYDALLRGDFDRASRLLPNEDRVPRPAERSARLMIWLRVLLHRDRRADAAPLFDRWCRDPRGDGSALRPMESGDLLFTLGDAGTWAESYAELGARPWMRFAQYAFDAADVMRGGLALRLGDIDAAQQHYEEGLAWARKPDVRFGLVQARCLQGLAEVAELRGDHSVAMQHLDGAGQLFAQYGAKLYLDQVLAKKRVLKA